MTHDAMLGLWESWEHMQLELDEKTEGIALWDALGTSRTMGTHPRIASKILSSSISTYVSAIHGEAYMQAIHGLAYHNDVICLHH